MRIRDYKFKRKEDKVVFKALMRCLKESNRLFLSTKAVSRSIGKKPPSSPGFEDIIRKCYASRENHPGENFQTNVYYWPDDCGGLINCQFLRLLYVAMIINGVNLKIKELGTRLNELHRQICSNPKGSFMTCNCDVAAFHDDIVNAFMKAGSEEEDAVNKANTIVLLSRAIEDDIPF